MLLVLCMLYTVFSTIGFVYCDHQCIHDEIWKNASCSFAQQNQIAQVYGDTNATTKEKFIRITFDFSRMETDKCKSVGMNKTVLSKNGVCYEYTCMQQDILDKKMVERLQRIVHEASKKVLQLIKVVPIIGKMRIHKDVDMPKNCIHDCKNMFLRFKDRNMEFENSDLVVFITSRPVDSGTLTWGVPLAFDQHHRPILGQINVGSQELTGRRVEDKELIHAISHELVHILGFSSVLFNQFSHNGEDKTIQVVQPNGQHIESAYLNTKYIKSMSKLHFGFDTCRGFKGAELSLSSMNKVGSHLNKLFFGNELMTKTYISTEDSSFSIISISLLLDTGWYRFIDFTRAEKLSWGLNEGCIFLSRTCNNWSDKYFCSVETSHGCSNDNKWTTSCRYEYHSNSLPEKFQYHSNPYLGGSSTVKYCTLMRPQVNCGDSKANIDTNRYGESFSPASRCFKSSLYKGMGEARISTRCYDYKCNSGKLLVKLANNWFDCPKEGVEVKVDGYDGVFRCPSSKVYCTAKAQWETCGSGCGDNGICYNGKCICNGDWIGENCNMKAECYSRNNRECNDHGNCSHLGKCKCEENWIGSTCEIYQNPYYLHFTNYTNGSHKPYLKKVKVFEQSWVYYSVNLTQTSGIVFKVQALRKSEGKHVSLFLQENKNPSFTNYLDFDKSAWVNSKSQHFIFYENNANKRIQLNFGIYNQHTENIILDVETILVNKSNVHSDDICSYHLPFELDYCSSETIHLQYSKCVPSLTQKSGKSLIYQVDVSGDNTVNVKYSAPNGKSKLLTARHLDYPSIGNKDTIINVDQWSSILNGKTAHQKINLDQKGKWLIKLIDVENPFQLDSQEGQICIEVENSNLMGGNTKCALDACKKRGNWVKREDQAICKCNYPLLWTGNCCQYLRGLSYTNYIFSPSPFRLFFDKTSADKHLSYPVQIEQGKYKLVLVHSPWPQCILSLTTSIKDLSIDSGVVVFITYISTAGQSYPRSTHASHRFISKDSLEKEPALLSPFSQHNSSDFSFYLSIYGTKINASELFLQIRDPAIKSKKESKSPVTPQTAGSSSLVMILSISICVTCLILACVGFLWYKRTKGVSKNGQANMCKQDGSKKNVENVEVIGSDGMDRWCKVVDPETSESYYFNERTRETSWEVPSSISLPSNLSNHNVYSKI